MLDLNKVNHLIGRTVSGANEEMARLGKQANAEIEKLSAYIESLEQRVEITTSQTREVGKIAEALAKAQAQMKPAVMNQTATIKRYDKFTDKYVDKEYRYADLQSVLEAAKPLAQNGIAIVQIPHVEFRSEGAKVYQVVKVATKLIHSSGECFSCTVTMIGANESPHTTGSSMTYGRRYGLACLAGISSEEDDDGHVAQNAAEEKKAAQRKTSGGQQAPSQNRQQAPSGRSTPAKKAAPAKKATSAKKVDPAKSESGQQQKSLPPPQPTVVDNDHARPMNDEERMRAGYISNADVRALTDVLKKNEFTPADFRAWLKDNHGYESLMFVKQKDLETISAQIDFAVEDIRGYAERVKK